MNTSTERLRFLNIYRKHVLSELDQMETGKVTRIEAGDPKSTPNIFTSAIAIAAIGLMFTGVFLIQ